LSGDLWGYVISSLSIVATIAAGNSASRIINRQWLKREIPAYFIIPSSRHHACDFAHQTTDEHRTTEIVIGIGCPLIIDLVMEPKREMTSSQVLAEFDGDLDDKPLILDVHNRFIEVGPRRTVIPGEEGNSDTSINIKDITRLRILTGPPIRRKRLDLGFWPENLEFSP